MNSSRILLVGDNPFQGVSHLSQERVVSRGEDLSSPSYCADLVMASVANGADGFMFTVDEKTLLILQSIAGKGRLSNLMLYPLVPDASGLIRMAGQKGGVVGLAKNLGIKAILSGSLGRMVEGIVGVATANHEAIFRSYLSYEVSRLKSIVGRRTILVSVLLHEIMTDMALALNMEWMFKVHIDFMTRLGIKAGFETRNFPYLVKKFEGWGLGLGGVVVATPFNRVGFQMCPSRLENEKALAEVTKAEVIAFSVLAAGYLKFPKAVGYIAGLRNLAGVAVGVSNKNQACETFRFLAGGLK